MKKYIKIPYRFIVLIVFFSINIVKAQESYNLLETTIDSSSGNKIIVVDKGLNFFIDDHNKREEYYSDEKINYMYLKCCYPCNQQDEFTVKDSVEITEHNTGVYVYKSEKYNDYFMIWTTEYNTLPLYDLFYISRDKIMRIGFLPIYYKLSKGLKEMYYPMTELKISGDDISFKIHFTDVVSFYTARLKELHFKPNKAVVRIKKGEKKMVLNNRITLNKFNTFSKKRK
ncbi:MAG: hypothetical protein NTZ33_08335 [Bacteroidetes bacterium]|nr:hypothetical protein [Bacteroidota bacterium]